VEGEGFDNFETAVASDRNYDIYWLGREFEAGGLTFKGPDVASFGDEIEGGGLAFTYTATNNRWYVKVRLYSEDAWTQEVERRSRYTRPYLESKPVAVAGHSGMLVTLKERPTSIEGRLLQLPIGRTHVEVVVDAVVVSTPGAPQPNPLMDEATFLAAMESLRAYPE
jgi:hypothetical protein